MNARRFLRGTNSSSSSDPGVTITARPEGSRMISLPSGVAPTTRGWAIRERFELEAKLFLLVREVDGAAVAVSGATLEAFGACADELSCARVAVFQADGWGVAAWPW